MLLSAIGLFMHIKRIAQEMLSEFPRKLVKLWPRRGTNEMEFASTKAVTALFHYCAFHPDRFEDLIANNRIYLSNTANFNDPWDCRPYFDTSRVSDPAYADRLVEYFYNAARKQTPHISEEVHRTKAAQFRASEDAMRAAIAQMSDMDAEIKKRYRVFCLTTKPSNILMWSHYANNHQGICIEFSSENDVFSGAFKVQYSEKYPLLDLTDDSVDRILRPLLTKSDAWAYEDEYRLIAQESKEALAPSLLTDDNYLKLPKGAIRSVILGCMTPQSTKQAIADTLARHGSGVSVKQLRRVPDVYELRFA